MSETSNDFLQRELARLQRELAEANAEAKNRRVGAKKQAKELEDLKAAHAELQRKHDDWERKATSAPNELQGRLDAAEARLLARDHADVFAALRDDTEVGLDPTIKPDQLWKLLDYKPEGPPEAGRIKALLQEALGKPEFGFLKAKAAPGETPNDAPGGAQQPPAKPALQVKHEGGRGGRDTAGHLVRVTKAQMQDPAFSLDPKNRAMLAQAQKDGTLQILP